MVMMICSTMGMDVKVVERAGKSVKSDAKSEPLRNKSCGRATCMSCSTGNEGGCETNSIAYKIECQGCLAIGKSAQYDGESARNGFSRGLEHQESLRNEREDSPLWKHCQLVHNVRRRKLPQLSRRANEAVRISSNTADHILNSKSEFHQAPIVRVVTTNGLQMEQGEEEVVVRGRGGGRRAERGQ